MYRAHLGGVDYTGLPVQVTYDAGSGPGAQLAINLTIIDDDLCEDQESIIAQFTASAPGQFITGLDECTVFITDNDGELLII